MGLCENLAKISAKGLRHQVNRLLAKLRVGRQLLGKLRKLNKDFKLKLNFRIHFSFQLISVFKLLWTTSRANISKN